MTVAQQPVREFGIDTSIDEKYQRDFVSAGFAADVIGVTRAHVIRNYCGTGKIACVKINGTGHGQWLIWRAYPGPYGLERFQQTNSGPVPMSTCPTCVGTGRLLGYDCSRCEGQGRR